MINKMNDTPDGLNLLSGYTPQTFLKPIMLISTLFNHEHEKAEGPRETAICFGNALNRPHLLEKVFASKECYKRAGWGDPMKEVSEFFVIKKHKTWESAYEYHIKLISTLTFSRYLKLYKKYCPDLLRRIE